METIFIYSFIYLFASDKTLVDAITRLSSVHSSFHRTTDETIQDHQILTCLYREMQRNNNQLNMVMNLEESNGLHYNEKDHR